MYLISGGLGNQLFQYIFFRFAQRTCPEEVWYLDDSHFFIDPVFNGYELEKIWGIRPNLLSGYFDKDVWEEIIRRRKEEETSLPTVFSNMGMPLTVIAETNDYFYQGQVLKAPSNRFLPEILRISGGNMYYTVIGSTSNGLRSTRRKTARNWRFPN